MPKIVVLSVTDSDGRSFHKDSESFDPPVGFLSQESVRAFDSRMEVGICKKLREAILSIVVDIFYRVVILRASIQLNKRLFEACGWLGDW